MATLIKKIKITSILTLKTGLHIGGTNENIEIGGIDKSVIKNGFKKNQPYIPGSSLKGKMRALVEIAKGCVSAKGGASEDPNSISGRLFGVATGRDNNRPSRLIVRDAELDVSNPAMFENTDLPYTESKTEVAIDRITAKANPRTFERVPAGAQFKLNMVLNIFEGEDEQQLKDTLKLAIRLLQDDYLGGHGSRGYGQVEIKLDNIEGKTETY